MYNHRAATIFVDNLPDQICKIWVFNLFSKYGKIRDIFIPMKKSKISGRNFGFVRFFHIEDAERAIAEVKDSWYWGHKLMVKFARFLRKEDELGPQRFLNSDGSAKIASWKQNSYGNHGFGHLRKENRGREVWRRKGIQESNKQGEQRNGNVQPEALTKTNKGSIIVQPIANGWLLRSAIAKIRRLVSPEDLELVFKWERAQKVQIKPIGGRFVIITFPDEESRDSMMKDKWLSSWFEEIKQWDGDQAKVERYVWLACYSMPLHAWSYSTFKDIGNHWGQFLQVDESTLNESSFVKARILITTDQLNKLEGSMDLVIDKVKYSVTVVEEETFKFIKQSLFNIPAELALEKSVAAENVENRDLVKEKSTEVSTKDRSQVEKDNFELETSKVNPNKVGVLPNNEVEFSKVIQKNEGVLNNYEEVDQLGSANSSLGDENSVMEKEMVLDSFGGLSMNTQPLVTTPNCLEVQETGSSNGLIVEESILHAVSKEDAFNTNVGTEVESEDEDFESNDNVNNGQDQDQFEENQIPIQAAFKGIKGKNKRKSINEILGYSRVEKGNNKGRRNKNKCVVLRSAVASAALSASLSSGGINNRNRILLDEAKAIWEVDKLFGIRYDSDEGEVISKIAEMEAINKDRAVVLA